MISNVNLHNDHRLSFSLSDASSGDLRVEVVATVAFVWNIWDM